MVILARFGNFANQALQFLHAQFRSLHIRAILAIAIVAWRIRVQPPVNRAGENAVGNIPRVGVGILFGETVGEFHDLPCGIVIDGIAFFSFIKGEIHAGLGVYGRIRPGIIEPIFISCVTGSDEDRITCAAAPFGHGSSSSEQFKEKSMSAVSDENPFNPPPEILRDWLTHASDFAMRWLERENHDPVVTMPNGADLSRRLDAPPPESPQEFDAVFAEFENLIVRHSRANGHPRFFAYVSASADPVGVVAELLAASMNQNVTAWRSAPGAASIERLVLRWLDELLGFNGGNGILTSGGSAANFNALSLAITRAERQGVTRANMAFYLSADTHLSLAKAARVLGLHDANRRELPVDDARRLRVDALEDAIAADRAAGLHPLLVCASAGTANCGAIDPIGAIADIAAREQLWLHIDGAYGAPAAMTKDYAWLRDAFARADSLSIDPHKWLYAPLDAGCLLFRDADLAKHAFSESAAYTAVTQTDPIEAYAFFDHGMELSRRFRALKLWFAFKLHGTRAYADAIAKNISLRACLDERIDRHPALERVASDLSISCFRAVRPGLDENELNALNQQLLDALLASGRFVLSPTTLDGKFLLRVCIVNFRTQTSDIDELVEALDAAIANSTD